MTFICRFNVREFCNNIYNIYSNMLLGLRELRRADFGVCAIVSCFTDSMCRTFLCSCLRSGMGANGLEAVETGENVISVFLCFLAVRCKSKSSFAAIQLNQHGWAGGKYKSATILASFDMPPSGTTTNIHTDYRYPFLTAYRNLMNNIRNSRLR